MVGTDTDTSTENASDTAGIRLVVRVGQYEKFRYWNWCQDGKYCIGWIISTSSLVVFTSFILELLYVSLCVIVKLLTQASK